MWIVRYIEEYLQVEQVHVQSEESFSLADNHIDQILRFRIWIKQYKFDLSIIPVYLIQEDKNKEVS